jgi:hypothetical protein
MRLGLEVHVVFPKILGFLGRPGLVRTFSAGRVDDRSLAGRDAGTRHGVVFDVINRLVEARSPVALQVGLAFRRAPDRCALDHRRLIVRQEFPARRTAASTSAPAAAGGRLPG